MYCFAKEDKESLMFTFSLDVVLYILFITKSILNQDMFAQLNVHIVVLLFILNYIQKFN